MASEEYVERDVNLFGPGFLEKASKGLEVEKTLAKVTLNQQENVLCAHIGILVQEVRPQTC